MGVLERYQEHRFRQSQNSDLDQQVAICEENGSRWVQCETADVRRLLVDAARYRWLREHLEYIEWEPTNESSLTSDTCDVGLDYAIDCHITGQIL